MPISKEVNREEVRMLVADLGYAETSQRTGIKEPTLRQWSKRGNWNVTRQHSQAVTTVTRAPADAHADALAEYGSETRLGLAKYARQAVGQINASVHPARYTKEAKDIAQTASIVHGWDKGDKDQAQVAVNIAILSS